MHPWLLQHKAPNRFCVNHLNHLLPLLNTHSPHYLYQYPLYHLFWDHPWTRLDLDLELDLDLDLDLELELDLDLALDLDLDLDLHLHLHLHVDLDLHLALELHLHLHVPLQLHLHHAHLPARPLSRPHSARRMGCPRGRSWQRMRIGRNAGPPNRRGAPTSSSSTNSGTVDKAQCTLRPQCPHTGSSAIHKLLPSSSSSPMLYKCLRSERHARLPWKRLHIEPLRGTPTSLRSMVCSAISSADTS